MSHAESGAQLTSPFRFLATILRILIGWHFLYEGLFKLFADQWSSGPYLMQSEWVLSGLFRSIAETPLLLKIVDLANIWGLTLLGVALILGVFTRAACFLGAGLLLLYYTANPPFLGYAFGSAEGHYLGVDKTLIESMALLMLGCLPKASGFGLDRLLCLIRRERKTKLDSEVHTPTVPREDNSLSLGFAGLKNRRELLKNLTVIPILGGVVLAALKRHGWRSYEEENLAGVDTVSQATVKTTSASTLDDLKALPPKGSIGKFEISRLIVGGNLISGFAHARDLIYVSSLLKSYFSDEKVIETLWLCESAGINTALLRTDENTVRILDKYWKRGGKIQWLAQVYPKENDVLSNINIALDNGAMGAFVQGNTADKFIQAGRIDLMEESIRHIKSRGVLAGTAGHSVRTIRTVEEAGLETDFYMKTLHHTKYWSARREGQNEEVIANKEDNYWDLNPEETIAYMEQVGKPWIAYKVLAAGAIKPKDGLDFAFKNGADFACVGMFDFQVVDNVNTVAKLFTTNWDRKRPWRG